MLNSINKDLFFSRQDPNDLRLGDVVIQAKVDDLVNSKALRKIAVLGYPDDEGIKLGGGRPGAALAPSRIRNFFYRMTAPAFLDQSDSKSHAQSPQVFDIGDLDPKFSNHILDRHAFAQMTALKVLQANARLITLGGGHDYGFPDAAAYCEYAIANQQRPLIINYDAHLDVRPTDRGITSGTPFFRLLEKYPDIDFVELGLQGQCNSSHHLSWARERGALCSFEEERLSEGISLAAVLQRFVGESALRRRSAFLSIDIDGFTSAVAPGASQSWPTGFQPQDFFDSLSWCLQRLDVRSIGIYETSPPLDVDDRTSRLAALIAHRFMFQL